MDHNQNYFQDKIHTRDYPLLRPQTTISHDPSLVLGLNFSLVTSLYDYVTINPNNPY